jgi:hypothetical protein
MSVDNNLRSLLVPLYTPSTSCGATCDRTRYVALASCSWSFVPLHRLLGCRPTSSLIKPTSASWRTCCRGDRILPRAVKSGWLETGILVVWIIDVYSCAGTHYNECYHILSTYDTQSAQIIDKVHTKTHHHAKPIPTKRSTFYPFLCLFLLDPATCPPRPPSSALLTAAILTFSGTLPQ